MHRTVIIGAGPGGTGPLIWAAENGLLPAWLDDGVALLDSSPAIGGTIGRYIVNSDTSASVYLEFLDSAPSRALFEPLLSEPSTHALRAIGEAYPPLSLVQTYLRRFGDLLEALFDRHSHSVYRRQVRARALHMTGGGRMLIELASRDGVIDQIAADAVVMALGGWQNPELLRRAELAPGLRLEDFDPTKIMPSDHFLTRQGLRDAVASLQRRPGPVVVLGGSHSAYSCVWALTQAMPEIDFAPGQITMLARRQPKIFYRSAQDAEADRYAFSESDICPRTRRVHRLGGLRSDGREIWRRLSGRPGVEPEARVRLTPLDGTTPAKQLRALLDEAALVIPAFGYRSRTVPLLDPHGRRVPLAADFGGAAVGRDGRFLTLGGESVSNLFGIGLGTGYRPWGAMGGEPGFDGQANSLWLYQHGIGEVVYHGVQSVLDRHRKRATAARPRPLGPAFAIAGRSGLRTI